MLIPALAEGQTGTCTKLGTTVNCTDVPTGGVNYASGVRTVNVWDEEEGETAVTPGKTGINLYLYGSTGNSDIEMEFEVIPWDTDGDETTDDVDVVRTKGSTEPLMVGDEFIFAFYSDPDDDPDTFMIGSETYNGKELAEFLSDSSVGAGGNVAGFLTVNNEAPFSTLDAIGIAATSAGGNGGSGSCWTILFHLYTLQ